MAPLFSIFILIVFAFLPFSGIAQPKISANEVFNLFENTSDQEGMFYTPGFSFTEFSKDTRQVNEDRLQSATKSKNTSGIIQSTSNLAFTELDDGNYEKAISYLNIALNALSTSGSREELIFYHILIGYSHYKMLNYDFAIKSFESALQNAETNKQQNIMPVANAFVAQTYLAKKDFANAAAYFRTAHNLFTASSQKMEQARMAVQLAELAIRKSEYDQARNYLEEALTIFQSISDRNGQALVHRNLGIIAFKINQLENAVESFKTSHSLSAQLSVAKLLKDAYLKWFTIKSLGGEHEVSNEINIIYVQLRDSIDQVERSRLSSSQYLRRDLVEREAITEMLRKNTSFSFKNLTAQEMEENRQLIDAEIERLEKEKIIEDLNMAKKMSDQANIEREDRIQQLTRQREMQDLALSRKELEVNRGQALRNTFILAFVFIIIIAALLYNRYRNQKKSHAQLDKAYQDLSETHQKLISAQEQLVHSQKMASLGQLTAGIAHEIQNPLNFVNNFSELSIELLDELRESGNNKEEIMIDLAANLSKINSHGKRADKIVKGMLTHSRAGQPDKHLADINKMIDELLDLSYHGNRSRDNTFTAEIIKNLDPSSPKVNIVMQDISRVLINLFNNAFYAVGQKVKIGDSNYTATVGVSTKIDVDSLLIKVRDNGTGIPDELRKKIFDPFFTTKPAGEGTGLGLSLSYDIIVKGHNGTLRVNSEKNAFTEFIITLPLSEVTA